MEKKEKAVTDKKVKKAKEIELTEEDKQLKDEIHHKVEQITT